jgi:hypothetical protein
MKIAILFIFGVAVLCGLLFLVGCVFAPQDVADPRDGWREEGGE